MKYSKLKKRVIIALIITVICIILAIVNQMSGNIPDDEIFYNGSYNITNITNTTNSTNNVTNTTNNNITTNNNENTTNNIINLNHIPPYSGKAYVELNGNIPEFEEKDYTTVSFKHFSPLDEHGRAEVAFANVCKEIMPKETDKRGNLTYNPTG